MKQFDIEKFKKALQQFTELKAKHTPYNGEEWKTNSSKKDNPAGECVEILEAIKKTLADVSAEWGMADAEIYVSKGAGYFPKVPWIGILFKGERPTDGVYPALGFYEDGFIVSCTASFSRPQPEFQKLCYKRGEIKLLKADNGESISEYVNVRTAKDSVTWFPYDALAKTSASAIENAVRKAIDVHYAYRDKFPIEKSAWFTVRKMKGVGEWLAEVGEKKGGMWVFRGQGDSAWMLEPGLGRGLFTEGELPECELKRLLEGEREMMDEFRREIARRIEYKSFRNVELLALMQHYGTKTRLLDFSFSPLVALYFALESYDDYMGHVKAFQKTHKDGDGKSDVAEVEAISVWAVDVEHVACPSRDEIDTIRGKNGVGNLRKENSGETRRERLELFHEEADAILVAKVSDSVKAGIDVVIPNANNERSSAQDGLFLMPCRMSKSFEVNLLRDRAKSESEQDETKWVKDKRVIRYDFPVDQVDEIKAFLARLRFSAKQIYPDLTGLAKSLNAKVDFKGKE